MIDSGNTWRSAISLNLCQRMGIQQEDIEPIPGPTTIGTAKTGSSLTPTGQLRRPLTLTIKNLPGVTYKIKPIVIDNLSMDMNLSGPWLKTHQWDQIHSKSALCIKNKLITLVASPMNDDRKLREDSIAYAYATSDFTAKADHLTMITLKVPAIAEGKMPNGECFVRGDSDFMTKTDLHPWINAIVHANDDGQLTAAVLNTTEDDIIVRRGTRYGSIIKTCTADEQDKFPWRICNLSRSNNQAEIMAQKAKEANAKQAKMVDLGKPASKCNRQERRKWILQQFKLAESPFLNTHEELEAAIDVLEEFWTSFSHDGSYGKTHLLKHRIITEDVPPIKCRYRPINPALEDDLRKQLDAWLEHDVIEPANSPWSFNLVAAKKKDGRIRWCVDWRRLNDITKKDSFPMPTVQDSLARLAGSSIFSAVDMQGAFHCIEMDERDREKTAFATPFGSFQQKMLGFGVTNGPPTYCRLVEMVLRGIPYSVAKS